MSFEKSSLQNAHGDGISHCCYTDDGMQVVTTGADGFIRIWDAVSRNELISHHVGETIFYQAVDGQLILLSIGNTVESYKFPPFNHIATEFQFNGQVNCIKVNSKYVAACSEDATIKVKPKDTFIAHFELNGHTAPVKSIHFGPNELLASSGDDEKVKIWNLIEKTCIQNISNFYTAAVISYKPKDARLMASLRNNCIYLTDTRSRFPKAQLEDYEITFNRMNCFTVCAYSNCGKYVSSGSSNGYISVWEPEAKKKLSQIDDGRDSEGARITSLSWNPRNNGELVYTNNAGQLGLIKIITDVDGNHDQSGVKGLEPSNVDCKALASDVPIRTIFIPSVVGFPEEIKEYFGQFGVVEGVRIQNKYDVVDCSSHFALVSFKTVEGAQAALSSYTPHVVPFFIDMSDYPKKDVMKFEAAYFWHQPDHPLLEPSQDQYQNDSLNDDCWDKILRYLNVTDLINCSNVCKRFEEKAKIAFNFKCAENFLPFDYATNDASLETLFSKFGRSIISMECDCHELKCDVLLFFEMLKRHCTGSLKKLKLETFNINDKRLSVLYPLFEGLKELELLDCTFSKKMKDLLGICNQLEVLKFVRCHVLDEKNESNIGECIKQKFPKLTTAEFRSNQNVRMEAFYEFITANPQLLKLKIKQDINKAGQQIIAPLVLRSIGEKLINLIELDIQIDNLTGWEKTIFDEDIQHFKQLKSLKSLKIGCISGSMSTFMEVLATNKIPIEQLELGSTAMVIDDETIEAISQMKQMKNLKISGYLTFQHLLKLTESLPDLHTLQCYKKIIINADELTDAMSCGKEFNLKIKRRGVEINAERYAISAKIVQNHLEGPKLMLTIKER